ncbi:MAG TPA: ABC transporter permease [Thermoanaerobaculia bacterium]|nr:ABC transporter permease [Thermoanaerobaculia bacterium]
MSWKKIFAVIRREYVERVRTKAFWIGTLLVPIFFLGYIAIQVASFKKTGGDRTIAVVDLTGHLFSPLQKDLAEREEQNRKSGGRSQGVHWILQQRPVSGTLEATKEQLRGEVLKKKIDGYLVLDPTLIEKSQAEYYAITVSEFVAMSQLERALNHILLKDKIEKRGLPPALATDLEKRLDLKTLKVTERGTAEEKGAGIFAAIIFMILMYTTFFMYGFQNLRGVIEEKTSRIVEVVIASVRPTELMLGKIFGIGLVGLTQYLIWSVIAMNLSLPAVASAMTTGDMGVPTIPVSMIVYFILFFLFGYFLYASIYTAIGAPFNTDQEAQQLAMIPGVFMVGCWAFYPAVLNNPNGSVATFVSLFPLTSPLMMFLRTAVAEPPFWQVLLSMAILLLSTVGIAWAAGRIYRVGILMYGKKPTIPEILRWVRYTPGRTPQPATPVKT